MPNIPIKFPEDVCKAGKEKIPDCVKSFLEKISPLKSINTKDTFDTALKNFEIEAQPQLLQLKNSLRDALSKKKELDKINQTLQNFAANFKCPGDDAKCGSLSEIVGNLRVLANQLKAQLELLSPDAILKQSNSVAQKFISETLAFASLNAVGIECPKDQASPENLVIEAQQVFDDTKVPKAPKNLKRGPATTNALVLGWEIPDDSNVLAYQISLNNSPLTVVPANVNTFTLPNIPNGQFVSVQLNSINTDFNPVESPEIALLNIQSGDTFPYITPVIQEILPLNGGFYLKWLTPDYIIDVQDFIKTNYDADVLDIENFLIATKEDFVSITQVRNDSSFGGLYDLTNAKIEIGVTHRVRLDQTNPLNGVIGLAASDTVYIDFSEIQDASFIFVSGSPVMVQVNNDELSAGRAELLEINFLRKLRPLDGEFDTYDLDQIEILDYRTFEFNFSSAAGIYDYLVQLDSNIQLQDTNNGDLIQFFFAESIDPVEGTVVSTSPLQLAIIDLVLDLPTLTEIKNINQDYSYILSGAVITLGKNFKIGASFGDPLQCSCKIRRKVNYINPTTWLLTCLDTSFSNVSGAFNFTRNAFYDLSGAFIFKGSTLIQLDKTLPQNQLIGLRGDDLIRVQNDDVTIAKFLLDDPDSNQFTWKLVLQNFELGASSFITEVRSIRNLSRPEQFYNLTGLTFVNNSLILQQSSGLNKQIGIDPRDLIKVDYVWQRFSTVVDHEILVDPNGMGYQFLHNVGTIDEHYEFGTRAIVQGINQEPFTITAQTADLIVECNGIQETIYLAEGTELDSLSIAQDILTKAVGLGATTSSGFLVLNCRRMIPREDPLAQSDGLDPCVDNGVCYINDLLKIVGGAAAPILGFSSGSSFFGLSLQNGLTYSVKIDAIDKDGRRTPFSLAGPNYGVVIPNKPIFEFTSLTQTAKTLGYLYNADCGDPTNPLCYLNPENAWLINFDLECATREIRSYDRLLAATASDTLAFIVTIPILISGLTDIVAIQNTNIETTASYDLTNLTLNLVSGASQSILNLDEALPTNIQIGMKSSDFIGVQLIDFYSYLPDPVNLPNYRSVSSTPIPDIGVSGSLITPISTSLNSFYGIDPYVKVKNIKATLPSYDPAAVNTVFDQPISLTFEAFSLEGVQSVAVWWKGKRQTFLAMNSLGNPLILQAGSDQPDRFGLYKFDDSLHILSATPRYAKIASIVPGVISTFTDDSDLITLNGQFNGWVLEFVTGVKAGLKYKIASSTLSPYQFSVQADLTGVLIDDIIAVHQRSFPTTWTNPYAGPITDEAIPVPEALANLFDKEDGFILALLTLTNKLMLYTVDANGQVIYLSPDAVRYNEVLQPQEGYNLELGFQTLNFDTIYSIKDVDVTFIDSKHWNVGLLIKSQFTNPEIKIDINGNTKLGEHIYSRLDYVIN